MVAAARCAESMLAVHHSQKNEPTDSARPNTRACVRGTTAGQRPTTVRFADPCRCRRRRHSSGCWRRPAASMPPGPGCSGSAADRRWPRSPAAWRDGGDQQEFDDAGFIKREVAQRGTAETDPDSAGRGAVVGSPRAFRDSAVNSLRAAVSRPAFYTEDGRPRRADLVLHGRFPAPACAAVSVARRFDVPGVQRP